MEKLEIPLTESMKKFIDLQVAAKGLANPCDYIAQLIEAAQEKDSIKALLLKGVQSETSEMTAQDWQEIREEGLKRLAKSRRS